ncbi:MAG: energy transducer TonB [Saprospiraceae bacterium]|nr:energy transducer TonB [Saprospiraceae bacterium]
MRKEKKDKHFVQRPAYPGGPKAMQEFLSRQLQYPEEALRNGIEGTVAIRYEIDYKGNVTDVQVLAGLGHGCDEEAVRIAKLLRFNVPPARGLKVLFHNTLKIHFHLPKAAPQSQVPSEVQYNYVAAPAKPPEEGAKPKPDSGGYSYTVTLGN